MICPSWTLLCETVEVHIVVTFTLGFDLCLILFLLKGRSTWAVVRALIPEDTYLFQVSVLGRLLFISSILLIVYILFQLESKKLKVYVLFFLSNLIYSLCLLSELSFLAYNQYLILLPTDVVFGGRVQVPGKGQKRHISEVAHAVLFRQSIS